jgi:Icc-related predicted phosphoesterase
MKVMWLTDLHLDRADDKNRKAFYERLRGQSADAVAITGDISDARLLPVHLRKLGEACAPRPVYFVLGNHDFFGSCFFDVEQVVSSVCKEQENLRHLGHGEIVPLGNGAALVGHRGWADGRAGWGARSVIHSPDHDLIGDFRALSKRAVFGRMEELGKASGQYFREVLPYALRCYEQVWMATHVPPFTWAAHYNGKPCGGHHLPHYSNLSAGCAINGICKYFPKSRLTVLCGHTHSPARVRISEQVQVFAGKARPGHPQVQSVFEVSKMPIPV